MSTKQIKKGFTLIELLVVISIIALLLSIMMPALNIAREQAKTTVCAVNMRSMGLALRMYEDNNDQKLPPQYLRLSPPAGTPREGYDTSVSGWLPWFTYLTHNADYADSNGNPIPVQLGKLHGPNLIDNPEIFYCPSQGFKGTSKHFGKLYYTYDYYTADGPWASYIPTAGYQPGQINTRIRLNYNYFLHKKKNFDELQDKPVVFGMVHHWYTLSHIRHNIPRGTNVLYGDGHVAFATNPNIFDYALWNGGPDCAHFQGPGHHFNLFKDILKIMEQQPY